MNKNADTKFGSLSWIEIVADSIESPSSRIGHSLLHFKGNLYLFGGKDEYSASNELWQYHIDDSVWTKLSYSGKKPPRRFHHSSIEYDNKMFVFGGSLDSNFSLWVFDFNIFEWELYGPDDSWPCNRHSQSMVLVNDNVYMYGGYTYLGTESDELWSYDIEDNTWVRIAATTVSGEKPTPMFGHSAVCNGSIIWIFGGSYEREILSSLWSYDTETIQWRHVVRSNCPPPLYYHIALVTGEVMLTYGGLDGNVKPYGGMWKFNFETEDWTQMVLSELPPLAGHAVAVSYIKPTEDGEKKVEALLTKSTERDDKLSSNDPITIITDADEILNLDNKSNLINEEISRLTQECGTVVVSDHDASTPESFVSQSIVVPLTPGDIELRPITNRSTITFIQCSTANSDVSLPGMVLDEDSVKSAPTNTTKETESSSKHMIGTSMSPRHIMETSQSPKHISDASSPPESQRIYHSVYENRVVSHQLENGSGFCVNNPLYDDTIDSPVSSREEQKTITFYDNQVLRDPKVDHSDSGSQGSRSSLKKKKKSYKRGFNTEFYIVGHGQEPLSKSVVLYRCKIG